MPRTRTDDSIDDTGAEPVGGQGAANRAASARTRDVASDPNASSTLGELVGGRRYRLESPIGAGAMGTVYRCLDRATGRRVALKRYEASPVRGLERETRRRLIGEFRVLSALSHPNIINVMDFAFDDLHRPFFTMAVREDAAHFVDALRARSARGRFELVAQLLRALSYLERTGVVHRDIKPPNVLVEGDRVLLLDFGLSLDARSAVDGAPSGTLAYLAPEVLRGQAATHRSDLYAVGVMAYEAFAGRHPDDPTDRASLIRSVLTTVPDLTAIDAPAHAAVIGRLLARDPRDRYATAGDALSAISAVLEEPLPFETATTRRSFLEAAKLVGRTTELDAIDAVLDRLRDPEASGVELVVLTGESGAGKSRLAEEARVRGMVSGVRVLRGQAVAEGKTAYQIWHDALLSLALEVTLTPLEAGVLHEGGIDITAGLDSDVSAPPQLDAEGSRARFLEVVASLVRRLERPLLVILEDMQWMGSDDLAILEGLVQLRAPHRIAIVGTCRDDEDAFLSDFDMLERIRVDRLPPVEVANLSEAILGPRGRDPHLLDFLGRETEGNPFFVVEVIRELAERAGELGRVAEHALPAQVFPTSVKNIVGDRLARLSSDDRRLVEVAAVAGRELDALTMAHIADDRFELWLNRCTSAGVIHREGVRHRFAHEKIREGVLRELTVERRVALHEAVGRAIEETHEVDAQINALAFHFDRAGVAIEAARYNGLAGTRALARAAYGEAIQHLELALRHGEHEPQRTRARWKRELGEANLGIGQPVHGRTHIEDALADLGWAAPRGALAIAGATVAQLARQVWRRNRRGEDDPRRALVDDELVEAARCYERLAEAYFFAGENLPLIHASLKCLNIAERIGPPTPELAKALANIHGAAGMIPWRTQAEHYARRAFDVVDATDDEAARVRVVWMTSNYALVNARWDEARAGFERLRTMSETIGYQRTWSIAVGSLHWIAAFEGRNDDADALAEEWQQTAEREDAQARVWALHALTLARLRRGEPDLALEPAKRSVDLLDEHIGREVALGTWAVRALVDARRGALDEAYGYAERASVYAQDRPMGFYVLYAHTALAEVYGRVAAASGSKRSSSRRMIATRGALQRMRRAFPLAAPASHRAAWQVALQAGQTAAAARAGAMALEAAREKGMIHEAEVMRRSIEDGQFYAL